MVEMQRGFRSALNKFFDETKEITITLDTTGSGEYDSCCFGVDVDNQLTDDNFMIFYNQTQSPNKEIELKDSGGNSSYTVSLSKLPNHIKKLVFTVSVDGNGTLSQLTSLALKVSQNNESLALNLNGSAFTSEKAVIAIEIYQKEGWRIAAVASGFNGGLSALLEHYGGEEVPATDATAPTPAQVPQSQPHPVPKPQIAPAPVKVSLEKRLEKDAPLLVSLVKPLKVSLEKYKLTETVAQVALLIDISGSMKRTFKNGTVQSVIDKMVPLAMQFDDDGEFEMWYFGKTSKRMPSINISNYSSATQDWLKLIKTYGGGTNLAPAIEEVINEYKMSKLPAYVLCITDGATANEGKVKKLITGAAQYPIFWQFVGIGGGNYGVVQAIDHLPGRKVDNANFFSLDDIGRVENTELYSRMLAEFPQWLKEAKRLGIL
ncbi:MAG: VWA domain-containing protein [Acetobacterium sp.]|nr:VWA domain-containing protein [Acetobacterium sp.]